MEHVTDPEPTFSPDKPTPTIDAYAMARIRGVPHDPQPLKHWRNWPVAIQSLTEYVTTAPVGLARVMGAVRRYPKPFRKVTWPSWDGTKIWAWLGVHTGEDGRPLARDAVIIVPGMFNTKDTPLHRARAIRLFRSWGFHVLALDLRGTGESERAYNTAGWRESDDVESAVDFMRTHAPAVKIHIFAESMGAVATILAAQRHARRGFRLVDGAVIAFSPYASAPRLIHMLDATPDDNAGLAALQWFFRRLLELGGKKYASFESYLEDAAKQYGVRLNQLYYRASITRHLRAVNVPLLIVCSDHDPLVPKSEVDRIEMALQGTTNPSILRLGWGSHCLFEVQDPEWFWALLHEYFGFYCRLPAPRRS